MWWIVPNGHEVGYDSATDNNVLNSQYSRQLCIHTRHIYYMPYIIRSGKHADHNLTQQFQLEGSKRTVATIY